MRCNYKRIPGFEQEYSLLYARPVHLANRIVDIVD